MGSRKILFWTHLSLGVCLGLVILFLALTGITISFERQITAWAERDVRFIPSPATGRPRLGLDDLAQKVEQAFPDSTITGLTLYADPRLAPYFDLGAEGIAYLNPYTGALLGQGAQGWRSFFKKITALHRYFGLPSEFHNEAKLFKGICTLLFGLLVISGLYLWWPQKWTRQVFRVIGVPNLKLRSQSRDWNWHNAVGFWSAPWLLIIIITGLIMAFPWANDLLYRMTGNEPPRSHSIQSPPKNLDPDGIVKKNGKGGTGKRNLALDPASIHFDAYLADVDKQCPGWVSLNIQTPQKKHKDVTVVVEEAGASRLFTRSVLTLDAASADLLKWEPYAAQNAGQRARSWVKPLHTGEAGGWLGQSLAALAALGAVIQIVTGLSMVWRRFFSKGFPQDQAQ